MRRRHITKVMVEKALMKPDSVVRGYNDKSLSFKKFPHGQVKVVSAELKGKPLVITVMWAKGGF